MFTTESCCVVATTGRHIDHLASLGHLTILRFRRNVYVTCLRVGLAFDAIDMALAAFSTFVFDAHDVFPISGHAKEKHGLHGHPFNAV